MSMDEKLENLDSSELMFIADILPEVNWISREKVVGVEYRIYCKGKD